MKKSIIAFGILFSVMFNTINANNNPKEGNLKVTKSTIKNVPPLSIAVAQGDFKTVKKFLELGVNVGVKSKRMEMTPLMYAARYNKVNVLKLLIDNGADKDATSKIGATALQYAEAAGANEVVTFLNSL